MGMGKELAKNFPSARRVFEEANDSLGFDLAGLCYEGPEDELVKTTNTQPAILTFSVACLEVLKEQGLQPHVAAGLSLGEYSALVAADSLKFDEAVKLVRKRGQYMQEAVPLGRGTMAAIIGLDRDEVLRLCREGSRWGVVEPANFNCPGQIVIAGEVEAVERAVALAKEAGAKRAVVLPVSAPFHCSLIRPAGVKLAEELAATDLSDAELPVMANVSARYIRRKDDIEVALINQVSSPVLWEDSVREMLKDGVDRFVEVGPGRSLSAFIKKIDREVPVANVEDIQSLEKVLDSWERGC